MKGNWNFLQKLGLILVLLSFSLLLGSELYTKWNSSQIELLNQQLLAAIPQRSAGDPMNYSESAMPVIQLEGKDFSGLLQVKKFGVTLPIGAGWDRDGIVTYPRRFSGSAYDNSLILGGSSRKGMFDFLGSLDIGDRITVTDLQGAQFSYEISRIDRRKNADLNTLQDSDSDLTLFALDESTMVYIIARGTFSPYAQ